MKKLMKAIAEKLNKRSTYVDSDLTDITDELYNEIRICEMIEILEQGGELENLQLEFFEMLIDERYTSAAMDELDMMIRASADADEINTIKWMSINAERS